LSSSHDEPLSALPYGLYETLIDARLNGLIDLLPETTHASKRELDPEESHIVLSRYVASALHDVLARMRGENKVLSQIDVCNALLSALQDVKNSHVELGLSLPQHAEQLLAIVETHRAGNPFYGKHGVLNRPETPLSMSSLLTGTRIDPSLMSQLIKEIQTADQIDILCSFIKWSGIRVLENVLRTFTARQDTRLRIITTSYMGATDPRAIDFLAELPNTELKISYDTKRTRLHAKAYVFYRYTGYGVAYIGSANLSHAAITDGLEWTVKISQSETAHLWDKAIGTFESYWNDPEFALYTAADRERFAAAITQERQSSTTPESIFQFDIKPYGYQQEILDRLDVERQVHDKWRNLIVAATGTGKTVIAAFDYKRQTTLPDPRSSNRLPRLLFVAHREEILAQSLACFRSVLRDQNFGDLFVGDHRPSQSDYLFVSIQTWNSRKLHDVFSQNHFDYVVVDEFHHAEAASYERLLSHVRPRILLGLTATPERGDGQDILHHFDGRTSAEIRLPDAINRKLLCPFQYFGITDSVDLSTLRWQRGGYMPGELEERYTDNDARADLVLRSLKDKVTDYRQCRGLAFCVSIRHAEYMAQYFRKSGISAEALTGQSPREHRRRVQRQLIDREINVIFTVDLYNEGVDIPEVDTVLFLRPTESLTVFLQQLGRGLRLHSEKECLTVLDFIGQAHQNFSFESRFRALMDSPRRRIDEEIEHGCLHLPLGCVLQLERVAQHHVLSNIRAAISHSKDALIRRIKTFGSDASQALTLRNFLNYHSLTPDDIYRRTTWSDMCAEAGVRPAFHEADALQLRKGFRRFAHINSATQIQDLRALLDLNAEELAQRLQTSSQLRRRLQIAVCSLWADMEVPDAEEGMARLTRNPTYKAELQELLGVRLDDVGSLTPPLQLPFECPLDLNGLYTLDEILTGLGYETATHRSSVRQGVVHLPKIKADAFFVTLNKSENDYSPSTMYEDYAISETLFHWQSQSTTSAAIGTGQRYVNHQKQGYTPLLFLREDKSKDNFTCPYFFLGPLEYVSHSGSRPMSIVWSMINPIPAYILAIARRMVVG
jgi:superfamily II DNA or RNA helicase/HKD family nuclease